MTSSNFVSLKFVKLAISGGTGITPFLSLFTHESFADYTNPRIYLGFRTKDYNIYDAELNNPRIPLKFVNSFYQDIDGLIDIHQIINESTEESIHFISGPPTMIKIFKQTLNKGVPASQILTDDWE